MPDEFEVIHHPRLRHMHLFLITIEYRTPHLHRDYELNYVLEGTLQVVTGGTVYTIEAGGLVLLNPNQPHELRTLSERGATLVCLQISPNFFSDLLPALENVFFDSVTPLSLFKKSVQIDLVANILQLATSYYGKKPYYELVCGSLLNMVVYLLLDHVPKHILSSEEERRIKKHVERLSRILEYVDNNYMHKIRLSDIAQQEGLSLNHLSYFVKENLNQTFQDYVNSVRYNQARKLILSTNKRLIDVCIESGFSDPRYLTKAFIQNTGMGPEEYRRSTTNQSIPSNVHRSLHSSQRLYSDIEAVKILSEVEL